MEPQPPPGGIRIEKGEQGKLRFCSSAGTAGIPDFSVGFDETTGLLCSLQSRGVERLLEPMEPTTWRPLNDNELVGYELPVQMHCTLLCAQLLNLRDPSPQGSWQHLRLHKWRLAGRPSKGGYLRLLQPLNTTPNADGSMTVGGRLCVTAFLACYSCS